MQDVRMKCNIVKLISIRDCFLVNYAIYPPFALGLELGAGAIIGIVAAILIVLLVVFLVIFARITGRWCFSGELTFNYSFLLLCKVKVPQ